MTKQGGNANIGGVIDGKLMVWTAMYGQSASFSTTTGHLVVRMKKGSQFWTPGCSGHVAYIHDHFTFMSGYKITDE